MMTYQWTGPTHTPCRNHMLCWVALSAAWFGPGTVRGEAIDVPNPSFEAPATDWVQIHINSWEEHPKPPDYPGIGQSAWTNLTGIFRNSDPGTSGHIVNCDGDQALWLWAEPGVGIFQDYDSVGWGDPGPSHAFEAYFRSDHAYRLEVGLIGGGGNMPAGSAIRLEFFYRNAIGAPERVAYRDVFHSPELFPTNTRFVDFALELPPVPTDARWARERIGIRIHAVVDPAIKGGYWDVDNVRLTEIPPPALSAVTFANGEIRMTVEAEPGAVLDIEALDNQGWENLNRVTNTTGSAVITDPTGSKQRLYRARQVP